MRVRHIVTYIIGGMEALLLARLVLRLFAARPDNPFVQTFLAVTGPLLTPMAFLDAGQPRYGATLELSTLALVMLLALAGLAIGLLRRSADRSTL
jgi:YggT family protein